MLKTMQLNSAAVVGEVQSGAETQSAVLTAWRAISLSVIAKDVTVYISNMVWREFVSIS